MPLRDHFQPPLSELRDWHVFHNAWASNLAFDINARLPPGYFAEPNVQFGIEIDVAAFEERSGGPAGLSNWTPPTATLTVPFTITADVVEVQVFRRFGGRVLAGAVELVSPANKDRPAHREAFVSKCETFLRDGVGLGVVDVVTERGGNLHDELMARVVGSAVGPAWGAPLYATAYRPAGRNGEGELAVWQEPLAIGRPLPTLPLWLKGGGCVELRLEATYEQTCERLRFPPAGEP